MHFIVHQLLMIRNQSQRYSFISTCVDVFFHFLLLCSKYGSYIRNGYSKFQTLPPSLSTVFVGLLCKRCQRSQCFQMHLSMLCTCWYLRICKSFLHFSSCSTSCLCAGIFATWTRYLLRAFLPFC